jgi:hypothetical protein
VILSEQRYSPHSPYSHQCIGGIIKGLCFSDLPEVFQGGYLSLRE